MQAIADGSALIAEPLRPRRPLSPGNPRVAEEQQSTLAARHLATFPMSSFDSQPWGRHERRLTLTPADAAARGLELLEFLHRHQRRRHRRMPVSPHIFARVGRSAGLGRVQALKMRAQGFRTSRCLDELIPPCRTWHCAHQPGRHAVHIIAVCDPIEAAS